MTPADDIAQLKRIIVGLLADAYRAEIARLTRQRNEFNILGWSDHDSDAEIAGEIADLEDELYRLEHAAEYDAPFTDAQIDAAQERMERLLGFTDADPSNAA